MLFNDRSLFASCFATIVPAFVPVLLGMTLILNAFQAIAQPIVEIETNLGTIEITLHPEAAPGHVENFLSYVNDGDYSNSFFHRSVPGFIIQVGGFAYSNQQVSNVPADPPVTNEYNLSNLRGTVAMAKLGSDPDSATNQWFINLADNAANLDNQNGGFTVFGTVTSGMAVADAIADLDIINAGGVFNSLPIRNTSSLSNPVVWDDHLVLINQATELVNVPTLPSLFSILLAALVTCLATRKKTAVNES